MRLLHRYHDYEIVGIERVPRTGGVLVAGTHGLATYESFLLASAGSDLLGRRPIIIGDDLIFRIPWLGRTMREIGLVPRDRSAVIEMLRRGEIVGVGPGGMRDALRSSRKKYQFDWTGRLGFVWVSMLAGVPIVLAACPKADDIYTVYDNPITGWVYQRFRVPLPLFRGVGPTLLPRPVKLFHVFGEPIYPPVPPEHVSEADVIRHHQYVVGRMHELIAQTLALSAQRSVSVGR
ncbi:MAG TPA: lysophospholipid acyltransferase family protein [Kofleriaceae bacterium]